MAKNLWKSGRAARNDARPGDTDPLSSPDPDVDGVGAILRKRREERSEDLRYVAQILRIRYPYLKAIEDGHPDELPGPTYAVGFVRTYADHLGLDSEKLVQQFKEEAAGLQSRADLHFPAPLPEGKIPSGVVLVMAVVLAAVIYGAWIYLSSRDQQVAEIVPQLPNRISDIIKGKPGAEKPAGSVTASAPPAASASPSPAAPAGEAPGATVGMAAPPEQPAPATPFAANPTSVTTPPAATPPVTTPPVAAAPAPQAETMPSPRPERPAAAPESVATTAPETPSTESIPQPPGSGTDSSESDVTPPPTVVTSETPDSGQGTTETASASIIDRTPAKVYGEENAGARVVIHAAADSWVEVRDSTTDELLLTRVLFKGDRYNVPDRGGLTLLTGNAGGLRIVVDGTDAPAIGPLGAVRRNVSLEPSALRAGNAVRPSGGGSGPTDSQTSDSGVQSQ